MIPMANARWVVVGDNEQSVFAWLRKGGEGSAPLLVVHNFTPQVLDGYRIGATAAEAQAASYARRWESEIKQYEAGMNITYQVARTNNDAVTHANDARMEAAKVGLTAKAQQLASALSMVTAQAQIDGRVNWNYNGQI